MKTLILEPSGWPCRYDEAPPGPFLWNDVLCFKSEYKTATGEIEGYNSSGEFLVCENQNIVQPVISVWIED